LLIVPLHDHSTRLVVPANREKLGRQRNGVDANRFPKLPFAPIVLPPMADRAQRDRPSVMRLFADADIPLAWG